MLIGLTGGIGSGKSTVADIFRKYGYPIIDADLIAREIVEPGKKAWNEIVEYFGEDILLSDKSLNRKKLGDIIFADKDKRKKLNDITHPIIILEILNRANALHSEYENIIVEIPLLYESQSENIFDLIIVVYVKKEIQLERLMNREDIPKSEAIQKINSQMDLEEKKDKADVVIYNDKEIGETENQIKLFIEKIEGKLD